MSSVNAPEWVNQELFRGLLKQNYNDFEVQKYECKAAISGGENYLTTVLRIAIRIRLKDDSYKEISYILKIPLDNDHGDEHDFHALFLAEADMYDRLVPQLEKMYSENAQLSVRFKPAHLRFVENPPKCDYILMEDLRALGYINLQRMVGLGQTETKAVLKKLAQWHAASAQRVAKLGNYEEGYRNSYMTQEGVKWIEQMNINFNVPYLECMQQEYDLDPGQQQLISNYMDRMTDMYLDFGRVDESDFNVFNHGDFWCNNFLFQLDEGVIKDICFIDFQLPKYGTPAQDLFCLLMTTPNAHIKLEMFDDFIEYYHKQLVEHLELLKYPRRIPTLAELHDNIRKKSLWAFVCAQRMLPVTLFPPSPESNVSNFSGDSEAAMNFKRKLLTNPSYVKQIKAILPWLIERGYIN